MSFVPAGYIVVCQVPVDWRYDNEDLWFEQIGADDA